MLSQFDRKIKATPVAFLTKAAAISVGRPSRAAAGFPAGAIGGACTPAPHLGPKTGFFLYFAHVITYYRLVSPMGLRDGRTTMTQSQIVKKLADDCQVSNKAARAMLTSLADTAISQVKKNGIFVLPGLGRLVRVERKARMGRNPATGEAIKIPAKKVVKFRVAKSAKDAIVPPKAKKASV